MVSVLSRCVGTSGGLQVSSYYVLQHRTLSTGLAAHDYYLGEINRILYTNGRENILKLVHQSAGRVSTPAQNKGTVGASNVMRPGSEMPPCAATDIFEELEVASRCYTICWDLKVVLFENYVEELYVRSWQRAREPSWLLNVQVHTQL